MCCCRPDGSRAEIYLKREDLNHTGAHKINNSLGQALLCLRMNKRRIIAETGAGQHGVATVSSCSISARLCLFTVATACSSVSYRPLYMIQQLHCTRPKVDLGLGSSSLSARQCVHVVIC